MEWKDLDSRRCSVARTAEVVGDGWTVLVLRDLFNGVRRFDDLAAHLGIARNMLTRRLAALVEEGIVERVPYREPGARERHEYRLTAAGRDLRPVLLAMLAWGDAHRAAPTVRRCGSSTPSAAPPCTSSCAAPRATPSTRAPPALGADRLLNRAPQRPARPQ